MLRRFVPLMVALALMLPAVACDDDGGASDPGGATDVVQPTDVSDVTDPGQTLPDADSPDVAGDAVEDPGVADTGVDVPLVGPGTVRFLHASDMHYYGTPENWRPATMSNRVNRLNALPNPPEFVVVTGDLVDFLPLQYNDTSIEGPLHGFKNGMDALDVPWYASIGNHEHYDSHEPVLTMTEDGPARVAVWEEVLGRTSPQQWDVNGVRFVTLNSVEDGAWAENAGLMGRFSEGQLDQLDAWLTDGLPTFLFFHHPPNTLSDLPGHRSLCDLIQAHPGVVKGLFTGHLHGFWKGEYCGVPYFVVVNFQDAPDTWFEMRYEGDTDTLIIENEARIPFPEVPVVECDPEAEGPDTPEVAVGTFQALRIERTVTSGDGLAQYVGEALGEIPFVLSFDAWNGEAPRWDARLTIASRWETSGLWTYVEGSPCMSFNLPLEGPCMAAGPVMLQIDILPFLSGLSEDPIDPAWRARLDVQDFRVEGRMGVDGDGVPILEEGLVEATLGKAVTEMDLRGVMVVEYCAGRMDGCPPGESGLPACPDTPDHTFFESIPLECDILIQGIGGRMVLDMVGSLPESLSIVGTARTQVLRVGTDPATADVVPELFDTTEGANCAP